MLIGQRVRMEILGKEREGTVIHLEPDGSAVVELGRMENCTGIPGRPHVRWTVHVPVEAQATVA